MIQQYFIVGSVFYNFIMKNFKRAANLKQMYSEYIHIPSAQGLKLISYYVYVTIHLYLPIHIYSSLYHPSDHLVSVTCFKVSCRHWYISL